MKVIKAIPKINTSYIFIGDYSEYKDMVKELKIKFVYQFSGSESKNMTHIGSVRRYDGNLKYPASQLGGPIYFAEDCFGFVDNGTWFLCFSHGFSDFEEYDNAIGLGCHNKQELIAIEQGGFKTYSELLEAQQNGFNSKNEMMEAHDIGCETKEEYNKIKTTGFLNKDEYLVAQNIGIESKNEYIEYQENEKHMKENNLGTHDEVLLHKYLIQNIANLNIDTIGINKIVSQINRNIIMRSPKWYVKGINNYEYFENLIIEKKEANEYFYNKDLDIFQEKPIVFSNTEIVLDGSNIAWNNGSSDTGDKPLIRNVILVTKDLINKGFISIRIYFDANIEYEIDDKQTYKQLENTFNIKKVPSGEKADNYILDYAKQNKTYVISNDQYTEYRNIDKWFEKNLDKIKVQFTIEGDKVSYSKIIEK